MNSFAIFQQAQAALAKNPNDEHAQFTVDLWNASKNLAEKNVRLTADLNAMTLRNADLSHRMDMILSRDTPVSGEAFMSKLVSTTSTARLDD
jgi:hypothetical protein